MENMQKEQALKELDQSELAQVNGGYIPGYPGDDDHDSDDNNGGGATGGW